MHEYPAEFRTQAVQLAITSDKSQRVVADEVGVGLTAQQSLEQENRRLKRVAAFLLAIEQHHTGLGV